MRLLVDFWYFRRLMHDASRGRYFLLRKEMSGWDDDEQQYRVPIRTRIMLFAVGFSGGYTIGMASVLLPTLMAKRVICSAVRKQALTRGAFMGCCLSVGAQIRA